MDSSLVDEFVVEANELLDIAEESLIDLESEGNLQENYNSIFRSLHSLKGGAGMMGLMDLQSHIHLLEDAFQSIGEEEDKLKSTVSYFLEGVDAARTILTGGITNFQHGLNLATKTSEEKKINPNIQESEEHLSLLPSQISVACKNKDNLNYLKKIIPHNYPTVRFFESLVSLKKDKKKLRDIYIIESDIILDNTDNNYLKSLKSKYEVIVLTSSVTNDLSTNDLFSGCSFLSIEQDHFSGNQLLNSVIKIRAAARLRRRLLCIIMYQYIDIDASLRKEGRDHVSENIKREVMEILKEKTVMGLK